MFLNVQPCFTETVTPKEIHFPSCLALALIRLLLKLHVVEANYRREAQPESYGLGRLKTKTSVPTLGILCDTKSQPSSPA
jgi:hypothetical protein